MVVKDVTMEKTEKVWKAVVKDGGRGDDTRDKEVDGGSGGGNCKFVQSNVLSSHTI